MTSQLTVESRIDRAENAQGLGPRTSVGAFHLAYIEKIPEAKKWRCRCDSGGDNSMSQIKGDTIGRTSKERDEPLILEL